MNIDLEKLGCSREDLLGFAQIVKKVKPSHIYVLGFKGRFELASCNTYDGGHAISRDRVIIKAPYKGKNTEGFVETRAFTEALKSKSGVLVFPRSDKPAHWARNMGMRTNYLKPTIGRTLHEALDYLMRVDIFRAEDHLSGLFFTHGEITATDGKVMHIDQRLPPMLPVGQYRLMGAGAASALMHAARQMPGAEVLGGWQANDEVGFYFQLKHGKIEVTVTSQPTLEALDVSKGRPPGDENNAAFTVFKDHLEAVVDYALKIEKGFDDRNKKKGVKGTAVIEFTHRTDKEGVPHLDAHPRVAYTDLNHVDREDPTKDRHYLICNPTSGWNPGRHFTLSASYLKAAISDLGPHIQFVLPSHPEDGLKHCYVNPVYVTGEAGRFAVISPFYDRKKAEEIKTARALRKETAA